jgi:hypothetical protein
MSIILSRKSGAVGGFSIASLPEITSLDGTEEFPLNEGGGLTRKITAANMASYFGGDGYSPADTPPGSPDTFDDEFTDSTSLSDWTAYGDALDIEDIDTTITGRLYAQRTYSGSANAKVSGRYKAISTSGTYDVAIGRAQGNGNGRSGCVVILGTGTISDSSPVALFGWIQGSSTLQLVRHSALATWAENVTSLSIAYPKLYLRLKFNSATSVDLSYSLDGIVWHSFQSAYNPGWNMDKIGWGISTEGATISSFCTYDWFRKVA